MNHRIYLIAAMVLLALSAVAQRPDNYPPDDTTVTIDETNLPIVWIDVNGAQIDREERITAHMKIIHNGDGQLNYGDTVAHPGQHIDYEGYIALRYRGNTSFNESDRKPYSFRTLNAPLEADSCKKQKEKILGMGKDNNWALLAPYADKSMIRDVLTFNLARPWMDYAPDARFCEVFLDGTYYGIYVMTEVVSKGKHRLDLDDPGEEGNDLTGGYMMEVDRTDEPHMVSKYRPVNTAGVAYQDRECYYQYKIPDYEDMTPAQIDYITQRVNDMEDAMASKQYRDPEVGYRKYIDEQSFADYQLFMELAHNPDAYRLSGKFFKRRDSVDARFKMVLWDLNLGYGNCAKYLSSRTDTWMHRCNYMFYNNGDVNLIPFWWYKLNKDTYYTSLLQERWADFRNNNLKTERIMATIDSLANVLTAHGAMDRSSQAWPRWGVWVWPIEYVAKSFDAEINHLKNWINARITWMDTQLKYTPPVVIPGDVNGDGEATIDDVAALIDYLLSDSSDINADNADCNQDGDITIDDLARLIDLLLTGE